MPWPQVPSVLQPMVLSLSLEALVDRRTVQQVCQQAQLRKLGQAKLLQSVQVRLRERARRARAHTVAPRRRAHAPKRLAEEHHDASPRRRHAPAVHGPSPGVSHPSSQSVVQAQARLRDAKRAAGLDERIVQARPSPLSPDT